MEEIPLSAPVQRALEKLGQDISSGRRRRRITQASLAERIGCSLTTIRRLEKGDPRIPIHFVGRVLHLFGEIERLSNLLDTSQDLIGLSLANQQLPQRVRTRKNSGDAGAR